MRDIRGFYGIRIPVVLGIIGVAMFSGCAGFGSVADIGAKAGASAGVLSQQQAESIGRSAREIERSAEDLTPEQEYYIGRSVGAVILDSYDPWDQEAANKYLNLLGQSIALASERPELFGGYRFQILDTEEINAFATPSGIVFVSRGMLRLTRSEDEVAAVLAHEVGHIEQRHGVKAIRSSRITSAFSSTAMTAVELAGPEEVAALTRTFDDSISDITNTLVTNGYSRGAEREADRAAVRILGSLGYDQAALIRVLEAMDEVWHDGGPGFLSTHPKPADRIRDIRSAIGAGSAAGTSSAQRARQARYQAALDGV
jgi:beta-barrel assembly-enhancing protease